MKISNNTIISTLTILLCGTFSHAAINGVESLFSDINEEEVTVNEIVTGYSDAYNNDDISTRIVGGNPADKSEFPWFVSPGRGSGAVCGASLIHPRWVLTAGHCNLAWRVGAEVNLNIDNRHQTGSAISRGITKIIRHPSFAQSNQGILNDVMLLMLDRPINNVRPVRLESDTNAPSTGRQVTVMGFGKTSSSSSSVSSILRKVTVNALDNSRCRVYRNFNSQINVCAAAPGKDSCQGDSGGPLVDAYSMVQVGVVSYGAGCGGQYPGVYARVAHFLPWIKQTMCRHGGHWCNGGGGNPGPTPTPPSPTPPSCKGNGERCSDYRQCCSMRCHWYHGCQGGNPPSPPVPAPTPAPTPRPVQAPACKATNARCSSNAECCSKDCHWWYRYCKGPATAPTCKANGNRCYSGSQCCSGNCHWFYRKCQQ